MSCKLQPEPFETLFFLENFKIFGFNFSSMVIEFIMEIFFLMISTFAYVLYQIYGGNPLENIDNLSQQATIQKLIVLVNILCVFIISFAFSNQYKILNQNKGL